MTGAAVMAALLSIWSAKRVTVGRVRRRIGAGTKWAVTSVGLSACRLWAVQRHQRALPRTELLAALARVGAATPAAAVRPAFEFLVLTATRSREARNARWEAINRDGAVWTIPDERMKNDREHRVPLSDPRPLGARRGRRAGRGGRLGVPVAAGPYATPEVPLGAHARAGR